MKTMLMAVALAAGAVPGLLAQAHPADPQAPAPAPAYRWEFGALHPAPPGTGPQPGDWARANAEVGRNLRGHLDLLQWERAAPPATAKTTASEAAAQATPNAAPDAAPAPAPDATPLAATEVLTPAQAVALALRQQPQLLGGAAASALEQARLDTARLALTHQVLRAWIDAVAARQTEAALRRMADAAGLGAELGQRMVRVGNWSRAELLQQQAVQAQAISAFAQAQQAAFSATEALVRLLGLWGPASQPRLPASLPDLPTTAPDGSDLEATALRRQPDLALAWQAAQQASAAVPERLMRHWQQAADAALHAAAPADAYSLDPLRAAPLMDPRVNALSPALAHAVQAQAQAQHLAVATRSRAREAYFRWRSALDLAAHQRQTAALTAALFEETQLRYNGMLQSTWDLLASARARMQGEAAALQAQRDAWLAYVDLQATLGGAAPALSPQPAAAGIAPAAPAGH